MALPLDTVVQQLRESGIVAPEQLAKFLPPNAAPKDGDALCLELVKQNLLTKFQAQQVAAGKTRTLLLDVYSIVDKIGAGGMGQVFKARHRRMERTVALKVMSAAAMKDEAAVKRFQREVRAAARLEHPNIVTAYDSGEAGNVKYLVMQFVDGGDLSDLVKKNGPLPIDRAVNYVLQAARGLAFAHAEGVIHRDIKPANLLLDKKGVVKILDMGLARIESSDDGLTATEQVMGTVDYMSPEQAANTKGVDGRADIYSLGCTLWFLLTGKKAYEADSMIARLMAHKDAPLPSLVKARDDAPWPLEQAFHRMIAKRAEDRFQSMDEVIAALEPFAAGGISPTGMGSSLGQGSQNAELSAFLKGVGPATKPQAKPSPSKTNVEIEATAQFVKEAETDPKSELAVPSLAAGLAPRSAAAKPQTKGAGGRSPPNRMVLIGGAAVVLIVALGAWFALSGKRDEAATPPTQVAAVTNVPRPIGTGAAPIATPPLPSGRGSSTADFSLPGGPSFFGGTKPPPGDYALQFDGNNEVSFDEAVPYNPTAFTIEAFAKPTATARDAIVYAISSKGRIVTSYEDGTKWYIDHYRDPDGHFGAETKQPIELGRRVHLAGVFDQDTFRLYVDGKLVAQTGRVAGVPFSASPTMPHIGRMFRGLIDDVRVSKRARYAAEFTPPTRHENDPDTLALYHFDEGAGYELRDSSGNNRHGFVKGAVWVKADGSAIPQSAAPTPSFYSRPAAQVVPPSADGFVYLDDLKPAVWSGSFDQLKTHGLGYAGNPIAWHGKQPSHSLFTHAADDGTQQLSYSLDGRYEMFAADVGLDNAITKVDAATPLTFRVLGDGRELWKSSPIQKRADEGTFSVSVRGVRDLVLEIVCLGPSMHGHAVWLNPRLTPAADVVYLDDLTEKTWVGRGNLGKHGLALDGKPFFRQGIQPPHCLLMHPDLSLKAAFVEYSLSARFERLQAEAGISTQPREPLSFRVLGDGKLLWESSPHADPAAMLPVDLNLHGVDVLRLEVLGPAFSGIWLEPRLTPVPAAIAPTTGGWTIVATETRDGPARLPATGAAPTISSDGLTFVGSTSGTERDVTMATRDRAGDPWPTPVNLGPIVNVQGGLQDAEDGYATISQDRKSLVFFSKREQADALWSTVRADAAQSFAAPVRLSDEINLPNRRSWYPGLSADGQWLTFLQAKGSREYTGRIARRKGTGPEFTDPHPLGPAIDALGDPRFSTVTNDGLTLVIVVAQTPAPDAPKSLWTATRRSTDAPFENPVELGPEFRTSNVLTASLSGDGRTLWIIRDGDLLQAVSPATGSTQGAKTTDVVYLDDLPETAFECKGQLGKQGRDRDGKDLNWLGQKPSHSIFTHVVGVKQPAWVTYALDGRYAEFRSTVGANIVPDSPMIFRILGDDKPLWESKPHVAAQVAEEAIIDVRGVKVLKLEASTLGSVSGAHAVWINPRLTPISNPPAPVSNPQAAAAVVYLDDLPEVRWAGRGDLGKHGRKAKIDGGGLIDWFLYYPKHSLFGTPGDVNRSAVIEYDLAGRYARFDATVGLLSEPGSPHTFRVWGDDKQLWESPPLSDPNTRNTLVSVDVAGVKRLKLELVTGGKPGPGYPVWIDPRLTPISAPQQPAPGGSPGAKTTAAPPPAVFPFDAATAVKHQEAWAAHLGVPVEFTNGLGMKFRLIPPGEFQMGLGPEFTDDVLLRLTFPADGKLSPRLSAARPAHPVRITRPFYLQVDEVTSGFYRTVIGQLRPEMPQDPNSPLDGHTAWSDAVLFCNKLSEREGKRPAYRIEGPKVTPLDDADGYRLPTEAEWEFACRAGTNTLWYFGNEADPNGKNFIAQCAGPNPFGLLRLYAGATEWCSDASARDGYAPALTARPDDPRDDSGPMRTQRGGGNSDVGGTGRQQINSFARFFGGDGPYDAAIHKWNGLGRVVLPIALPRATPGSAAVVPQVPPVAAPQPAAPPAAAPAPAAPRWPLAPSKPEDIVWLHGLKATLTLRAPSAFGGGPTDVRVQPGGPLPTGAATIVGIDFGRDNAALMTDDVLKRTATLVDLEDLSLDFGTVANAVTKDGLPQLATLVHLRRLSLTRIGARDTDPAFLERFVNLESLFLGSQTFSNWEPHVARLPALTELRLDKMGQANLARLVPMPRLKELGLSDYGAAEGSTRHQAAKQYAPLVPWCRITIFGANNPDPRVVIEPTAPTLERQVAQRLAALQITFLITVDGERREVDSTRPLPEVPFQIAGIAPGVSVSVPRAELSSLLGDFRRLTSVTGTFLPHKDADLWAEAFAAMPQMRSVNASGCEELTDVGAVHLARCSNLEYVNLASSRITRAGVAAFESCRKLTKIELNQTAFEAGRFTLADVQKLQDALPKTAIVFTGSKPIPGLKKPAVSNP